VTNKEPLLLRQRRCVIYGLHILFGKTKSLFSSQKVNPKSATVLITSNLTADAWSTKYRRKKKLITQFSCKSRDKSFEPN
jgi:hypothetical protein